jgi:uroporphyrinogen decarboxylase
MAEMKPRERYARMFAHQEADRIPLFEAPWNATLERWRREGLGDSDYVDYFGLDRMIQFKLDISPRYPVEVLEETDEYRIDTTEWGVTHKNWKHRASVPEMIDVRVKTPDDWREAKARMTLSEDRIPWDWLKKNWKGWQEKGDFIVPVGWFGFDVTHAQFVGTERVLFALVEDPEWIVDMWETELELNLALYDRMWEAGYHFDCFRWPDDMGYKYNQFFSLKMYQELLKPIHQRAIDWAHQKGVPTLLHSCGDVRPFIPDLVEMGLDGLNPLEVKAGVDPLAVKKQFGDRLLLYGGFNALDWYDMEKMEAAVRENIPILMQNGGYAFATDHSTPSNVSLEDFRKIVALVKKVGTF